MRLELSPEESTLIRSILESFYADLREEIYKTERFEYKEELRRQEKLVKGLIQRMTELAEPAAPA